MGLRRVRHDWATSLSLSTFMHWRRKWWPHSSVLAWRIPGTEEPGGLPSMGSHRVRHDWSDLACMHALEKETATHSSVFAWTIPGTEEPGGLPSTGSHRVGHNWSVLAAAAAYYIPDDLLFFHFNQERIKVSGDNNYILQWLNSILMTEQKPPLPPYASHYAKSSLNICIANQK